MPKVKETAAPKKPIDPKRAKALKINAEKARRRRIQKERITVVGCFMAQTGGLTEAQKDEELWYSITYLQNVPFYTDMCKMFRYALRGDSIAILRMPGKPPISKKTIMRAFHKALEMGGSVSGPTKLGAYGCAYIHPIFLKLGIVHIDD